MHNLEVLKSTVSDWFNDNIMKASPGKYHLLLSVDDPCKFAVENKTISSSKYNIETLQSI